MTTKEIALIDLVKQLGFENHKALSNRVRDILKDKEDFKKRFIVNYEEEHPEKTIITEEARILVDNLCVLKPYMGLFEKVTDKSNKFSAYQQLKFPNKQRKLTDRANKLKADLEFKQKAIKEALMQFPKVTAVLCSNQSIDITTDSLRELIEKACPSSEAVDFSKSFQIAVWNELSALEAQLKEEGETSETYRKIAEKILELGDEDGALEALDSATSMTHDDGIAWALKAKIYLDLLRKAGKEQMTALSLSDFSGGFEHPVNSEEQWINERIDDAYFSTENFHTLFVEACFFALEYCPCWDKSVCTDKNSVQKKNFKPEYTAGISRSWIFFHLVLNLKKLDAEKYATRFLEILRTFQSDYEAMPCPPYFILSPFSVEYQNETSFELKLIEVLSWISLDDCYQLLNGFVERFESWSWRWRSAEDVAILSSSNISQLFWNYLGREKFLCLYEKLESHAAKSRQMEKLELLCSIQWNSVLSGFNGNLQDLIVQQHFNKDTSIKPRLDEEWQLFIKQSYDKITGWDEFWNDSILLEKDYVLRAMKSTVFLFFVCPLIELQNDKPTEICVKILCQFSESEEALEIIANEYCDNESLWNMLIQPVIEHCQEQTQPWMLDVQKTLEMVLSATEEIRDEMLNYG